jgi:hypothetical protein
MSVVRAEGYSSALVLFGDSISRIRELENFLLREMENEDICIELVRIREFDSSGGRIELYPRPYFSVFSYNLSRSGKECKGVFRFGFRFRAKFIIRI